MSYRLIMLSVAILATGCAFNLEGSGVQHCSIFCGSMPPDSEGHRRLIRISSEYTTKFNASIEASTDNFFNRFKNNPNDVLLNSKIDEFIQPGLQFSSAFFGLPLMVTRSMSPTGRQMTLNIAEQDWNVIEKHNAAFERFSKLLNTPDSDLIRYKVAGVIDIHAIGNRMIYKVTYDVVLESKKLSDAQFVAAATGDAPRILLFAKIFFDDLTRIYSAYIKENFGFKLDIVSMKDVFTGGPETRAPL